MSALVVDIIHWERYIESEEGGTTSAASFPPQFVALGEEDAFVLAAFSYRQNLSAFELQGSKTLSFRAYMRRHRAHLQCHGDYVSNVLDVNLALHGRITRVRRDRCVGLLLVEADGQMTRFVYERALWCGRLRARHQLQPLFSVARFYSIRRGCAGRRVVWR